MNENTDAGRKNSICSVCLVSNTHLLGHQGIELLEEGKGALFLWGKMFSILVV